MAKEITVSATLSFSKTGSSDSFTVPSTQFDFTGVNYIRGTFTAATTPGTALPRTTTYGFAIIINRDTSNYVQVLTATGGTTIILLNPGEFCIVRLDAALTAPFVMAHTAACRIEYFMLEN